MVYTRKKCVIFKFIDYFSGFFLASRQFYFYLYMLRTSGNFTLKKTFKFLDGKLNTFRSVDTLMKFDA